MLAPLVVALPLLVAPVLGATGRWLPRWATNLAVLVTAAATAVVAGFLLLQPARVPVSWLGGWTPAQAGGVGIPLVADRAGAAGALLAAVLVTAVAAYSWRYFDTVSGVFPALLLVFLAGMGGFALSGDLFDMFVFFELMSAVAFALTAYRIEEPGPLQGALNFGVTNSLGAFCTLTGIGLLYARTGQLGLAPTGRALAGHRPDALVVAALVLVLTGFLVKASAVPFHFWTADAEMVAPTPVCALFSAVMVELGLYAVARVYWVVFSGTITPADLRGPLLVMATATALVGGALCLAQHHLKRLLAFSTVGHVGIFLLGVGLLTPSGLAAAGLYAAGHAGVKAALFLLVGVLVDRFGSAAERRLHGRGRRLPVTGLLFAVAGLALAGLPPFGTWLGKTALEEAMHEAGLGWLTWVPVLVSVLTGAAVLRAGLHVFLGVGPREADDDVAAEDADEGGSETERELRRTPVTMLVPAGLLLAAALAAGLSGALRSGAGEAAARFVDRPAYAATVLDGAPLAREAPAPVRTGGAAGLAGGLETALLAAGLAGVAVTRRGLPGRVLEAGRALALPLVWLRRLHSGQIGDYAAWLVVGVACLGGAVALAVAP